MDIEQNVNHLLTQLLELTEDGNEKKDKIPLETGDGTLCVACHDNRINTVLDPCSHGCLCEGCCITLKELDRYQCPVCGQEITNHYPLFLAGVADD